MKPYLLLFILLLSAQILRAQEQRLAKAIAPPDSAIGMLCTNAQGEPGILYNKAGGPEFHRLDNSRVATTPALKTAVTKGTAANTISAASKIPVPAAAVTNKNAAAPVKPSFRIINRDTISAPLQLEGDH